MIVREEIDKLKIKAISLMLNIMKDSNFIWKLRPIIKQIAIILAGLFCIEYIWDLPSVLSQLPFIKLPRGTELFLSIISLLIYSNIPNPKSPIFFDITQFVCQEHEGITICSINYLAINNTENDLVMFVDGIPYISNHGLFYSTVAISPKTAKEDTELFVKTFPKRPITGREMVSGIIILQFNNSKVYNNILKNGITVSLIDNLNRKYKIIISNTHPVFIQFLEKKKTLRE